jgi:hypothetical protein
VSGGRTVQTTKGRTFGRGGVGFGHDESLVLPPLRPVSDPDAGRVQESKRRAASFSCMMYAFLGSSSLMMSLTGPQQSTMFRRGSCGRVAPMVHENSTG